MKLPYDKDDLLEAVTTMRAGGIILYPTDTIWGIGCDATNTTAVSRIYRLKQRADTKSMLVLTDSPFSLMDYVEQIPDTAWQLIGATEGNGGQKPLTIIYPNARNVASNLISEDGSLGIRLTSEPFSKALCTALKHPVVSTSANLSGCPSPVNFSQIADEIKNGVDYVCHYRQTERNAHTPSSIVKIFPDETIKILRV